MRCRLGQGAARPGMTTWELRTCMHACAYVYPKARLHGARLQSCRRSKGSLPASRLAGRWVQVGSGPKLGHTTLCLCDAYVFARRCKRVQAQVRLLGHVLYAEHGRSTEVRGWLAQALCCMLDA